MFNSMPAVLAQVRAGKQDLVAKFHKEIVRIWPERHERWKQVMKSARIKLGREMPLYTYVTCTAVCPSDRAL